VEVPVGIPVVEVPVGIPVVEVHILLVGELLQGILLVGVVHLGNLPVVGRTVLVVDNLENRMTGLELTYTSN
jgi:hypothetical protein